MPRVSGHQKSAVMSDSLPLSAQVMQKLTLTASPQAAKAQAHVVGICSAWSCSCAVTHCSHCSNFIRLVDAVAIELPIIHGCLKIKSKSICRGCYEFGKFCGQSAVLFMLAASVSLVPGPAVTIGDPRTSVTHRIRELDDALQGAFAGIQEQVKQLREAVEDLEDRSRAKSEDGLEAFTGQQSMVLKEETWVMNDGPDMGEEEAHNLSAAALSLQRSATSQLERDSTRHSHLRLNSHLMELSMKAEEAVEAIGKGRWASSRDIPKAATRSRTFSVDINDPAYCRVLLPDDKFRLAWDTAISFVIGFEICILPLCTAWGVTFSPGHAENAGSMAAFLQVFSAFTLVLWPLDIILDFNTGFYRKGHLRLKRSEIAQRYLSTWFAFDITMVVLDIAACITSEQDDSLSQVLRMLQMLRVLRILKIGKISVILENLVIATGNYSLILTLTVGKVVVSIATVAHILACIWYALGGSFRK